MTNTSEDKQATFSSECRLINLQYEYQGYAGKEKWAIVSELTEQEIFLKYPEEVGQYVPFVLLSVEQGKPIDDYIQNEDKYWKRMNRSFDVYGYDDEVSSQFHKELCFYDELPTEYEERVILERFREKQIEALKEAMELLTETQKRRMKAVFCDGLTLRETAEAEGVCFTKIDKSISQSLKNLKKFWGNGGTKRHLCPNE